MIERTQFGEYEKYTVTVGELSVSVITLGAAICSLRFRGREMILGYEAAGKYAAGRDYMGAVLGRYAGRICGGSFMLNEKPISLAANDGADQLNGGAKAFDKRKWTAEIICANRLRFALASRDGDNGYPGALVAAVTYTVENNTLRIDFEGEAAADTVYAPACCLYFTLGKGGEALETCLAVNAAGWQETDGAGVPTGRLLPAEGENDFSSLRPVEKDRSLCFALAGEKALMAEKGETGLAVTTDYPALLLDTGSALHAPFEKHAGLGLMPCFPADSPCHPELPSPVLHRGERFHKFAEYHFYSRSEE